MKSLQFSVLLLTIALSLLGFWMIPQLQFNFSANYGQRSISVNYAYPGASAEIIEQTVTVPIEGGLSLIRGIEQLYSEVSRDHGVTRVEIDDDAEIDQVRFEIAQVIRQLYSQLPDEVSYPRISLNDPDQKILDPTLTSYSFSGDKARTELFEYAREVLSPALATVGGVYEIRLQGAEREEWHIVYRSEQILAFGLSEQELINKIRTHLHTQGLSYTMDGDRVRYVKMPSGALLDLLSQQLSLNTGHNVPWSSVIDIRRAEEQARSYYRINGQNSITLNFVPQASANHLQTAANIRMAIAYINNSLPTGTSIALVYDSTEYISEELHKIKDRTIWSLSILLLFVVLTYRSMSRIGILVISLIANLGIASLLYYIFDVQLNLYALAGVTVSFGLIIDNIIVVAHHYQDQGDLRIGAALLAASLTTLVALLIIFFLPDRMRWELIDFAKVLAINLTVSLAIALLFVPALIDRWNLSRSSHIRSERGVKRSRFLIRLNRSYARLLRYMRRHRYKGIAVLILLFGLPVFWMPKEVEGWSWYNQTIGSELYQDDIKPWVNKSLGGSLRLFSQYVYEGSAYRSPEETILHVNASMPQGSTIEQMNDLITTVERYLLQYSMQIKGFNTRIMSGQAAQIKISFPPDGDLSFPYVLKNRLQSAAIDLGGVDWSIYGVGKGFSNAGGSSPPRFRVMMKGYNKDQLDLLSNDFAALLMAHPRVQTVDQDANINWWEKDRYQYDMNVDQWSLASMGWSSLDLQNLLSSYHIDPRSIAYTDQNEAVRLIDLDQDTRDLWDLQHHQHMSDDRPLVLADVAQISKEKVSNSIHKEDQQYLRLLEFEYTGSGRFGQKHLDACMKIFGPTLPLGYTVEQNDFSYWGRQQKKQYSLIGIVIVIIFFICAIHFESIKASLLVILLIPMSYIGIFLTFYGFDFPFDQGGYTSFLLLSGIVVNSIILILSDYYRYRKAFPQRLPIDMYLRAYRHKITPIALTIISTALGLLPFTLHGSQEVFWFSLAVGTMGGLIFSLVLIIFFVPLFIKQ